MNATQQSGRLVADPEVRSLPSGAAVTVFTIAVDRRFKKPGGKQADFLKCEAWGKTGENIAQYFYKGKPIEISGRLEQQEWQDSAGNKKDRTVIVVENFYFVSGDKQSDGNADGDGSYGGPSEDDRQPSRRSQPADTEDPIDLKLEDEIEGLPGLPEDLPF
jgi:single-strand DNA-binding protein